MSRVKPWTIADLLDFEHLLSARGLTGDRQARARDRSMYEETIARKLSPAQAGNRRAVFREWLDLRRGEIGTDSPGKYFATGWQTVLAVGVISGLVLGGGLAGGLLHYHGDEPVNAVDFLKWTLGPQWLFLAGALLFLALRVAGFLENWEPLGALVRGLQDTLATLLRRMPGEKRARAQAAIHALHEHRERHGALATWPAVIVTQLFAVCFNLGVLATLLAELPVHELRFGWQTTLDVPPEKVGRFVAAFAAPWAWAPNAHPSIAQVAATRYAPGTRHDSLPGEAMRAWWPFLFYAVTLYGLAVRGALLLFAMVKLRAALRGLRFDYPDANALWHRLTGPVIDSEKILAAAENETVPPAPPDKPIHIGPCFALVAQEFDLAETTLRTHLANCFRWPLVRMLSVAIDRSLDGAAQLAELRASANDLAAVVIVVPATRDPIVAIGSFLEDVLAAAGKNPEVWLLLAGAGADEHLPYWHELKARHHLRLSIETWTTI